MSSLSRAQIVDKSEAAKYLAHTAWDSAGMSAMRELYCQNGENEENCRVAYGSGPGGVIYYGRGPMQLSHDYNYRAASQNIFGDPNVLLTDPDRVARDSQTGWDTAAYFWSANVHDNSKTFGQTLKKINGFLECDGGSAGHHMWTRCDHYRQILEILNMPLPERQADCYCSRH
jgi:predicted chitinase